MIFLKDQSTCYSLVYCANEEIVAALAMRTAELLTKQCGIAVEAIPDDTTDVVHEQKILFGKTSHLISEKIKSYMKKNSYFVGCYDDAFVIQSDERFGMAVGVLHLIQFLNADKTVSREWKACNNIFGDLYELPKDEFYRAAVSIGNQIYGTYCNLIAHHLELPVNLNEKKDQALVEALIKRMGKGFAVMAESSTALHKGNITKLDSKNYQGKTKLMNGHFLIPSEFANKYFGKTMPVDRNEYVDITAYCRQSTDYILYADEKVGLAVVTPSNTVSFENEATEVGGYTNQDYLSRMICFFKDYLPEPNNNVEQTRVVVEHLTDAETSYVFDYSNAMIDVLYSPAIYIRQENGKKVIYTAYEYATRKYMSRYVSSPVFLKRSRDDGHTWEIVATVSDMHWASLTEIDGKLYLIGNEIRSNTFLIAEYDPDTGVCKRVNFSLKPGGGAPNTVLIANGRIYKAFNFSVASAEIGSDLLKESNWTLSNNPQNLLPRAFFEKKVGSQTNPKGLYLLEEGNVIQSPNGQIYVMYRVDSNPIYGYTALFKLSSDGKTLVVEESTDGVVKFPYTQSKFSMHYDHKLGMYLSITSLSTMNHIHQRNVLGLVVSKDLINWEIVDVLLVDRAMMNRKCSMWAHAFQYVDFVLEETDLYFFVREAVGDTILYHDANYMTMYKIENYREFITARVCV